MTRIATGAGKCSIRQVLNFHKYLLTSFQHYLESTIFIFKNMSHESLRELAERVLNDAIMFTTCAKLYDLS